MTDKITKIKNELTVDELGRGYSGMTAEQKAASLNAPDRPADGSATGMLQWLATHKNRSNDGSDTVGTAMLGRLRSVAEAAVGDDPFGRGVGNEVTLPQKHAAQAFLILVSSEAVVLDFTNTDVGLFFDEMESATVWKPADTTALQALSQNKQSRGQEIGAGHVRVGHILEAEA